MVFNKSKVGNSSICQLTQNVAPELAVFWCGIILLGKIYHLNQLFNLLLLFQINFFLSASLQICLISHE